MTSKERRPSKQDPSRAARSGDYEYKKRFYQSSEVADDYDFHRFSTNDRARRNARKWQTILKGLDKTTRVRRVLDMPCGTGRFTGHLAREGYHVVGCDISVPMMNKAQDAVEGTQGILGFAQGDAERLPFADRSFDCVISIRFLFHIDPVTRVRILREMGRVSRRWVIVDYRHRHSYRYFMWRLRWMLGLTSEKLRRVSRQDVEHEMRTAGLAVKHVIPVTRIFSDKWIVVGEAPSPASLRRRR
jgi:ubiquinone/menaquinone biosynthesis C-methylase UbiE